MGTTFTKITPELIPDNTFELIGSDWMLITAGTKDSCNMMTGSWGGLGVLWHKNVSWCFIRPQRHTFGFMEKGDYYTISFFPPKHKKIVEFCGSRSGKNVDKVAQLGLEPRETEEGSVYFSEARLVLSCRKIYFHDIDPKNFVDEIHTHYPKKDYHRMYTGEILYALRKD